MNKNVLFEYDVFELSKGKYHFNIYGVSYIGNPLSHTAMYVSKKVEKLLVNLKDKEHCLIFSEENIDIPEDLLKNNLFIKTTTPQKDYALFVGKMSDKIEKKNAERKFSLTKAGYYIGENVEIGVNSYIEPGVVIGHDVVIGDNAFIKAGAVLKNCKIGDNFIAGENSIIGSYGFTMADDDNGNKMRIPTLGNVMIGNHVEIGALANVSRGSAGDTMIDDYVKIDSFVYIGHDAHLHKNVELLAGAIIGGFVEMKEGSYAGINSSLRNRITIGENALIGMGAVVTKSVETNLTVVGNPAKPLIKK